MNGNKSVGIYARSAKSSAGTLTMDFENTSGNRVPLVLNGDSSIGIYNS